MSAVGETGAAARSIIASLGTNPVVLALVLINLAMVGLLYWSAGIAERERHEERKLLYQNRTEVGQLLAKCTMTPP